MFDSDNQIFEISGTLSQLEEVLRFALSYSGQLEKFKQSEIDRGCKTVFQVTEDGRYCIGWGFETVPEGWTEYQFRPDVSIISLIIRQNIENAPLNDYDFDGISEHGFILKAIDYDTEGVENPYYGLFVIEPYTILYGK